MALGLSLSNVIKTLVLGYFSDIFLLEKEEESNKEQADITYEIYFSLPSSVRKEFPHIQIKTTLNYTVYPAVLRSSYLQESKLYEILYRLLKDNEDLSSEIEEEKGKGPIIKITERVVKTEATYLAFLANAFTLSRHLTEEERETVFKKAGLN